MALTYSSFNKFDDVVKHYESIKPVKEKEHGTARNIRPIGDRARKWERIIKISRNCYALSDGYHYGDDTFVPYNAKEYDNSTKSWVVQWDRIGKMEYYAPIVWRKDKYGTETVQIRNFTGSNGGYEISRYAFLERHMPYGLHFRMGHNSLQYVETLGEKHYLAKAKTVPRGIFSFYKKNDYYSDWMQTTDDNSALVFISDEGGWVHSPSTGKPLPQKPKVNKELKAKYKEAINKFFEWGMTMSPLLPLSNEYNATKAEELREHFGGRHDNFTPTSAREILRKPNHPMRLNYWVSFTTQISDYQYNRESQNWDFIYPVKHVETKEQLQRIKNKFNSFININAGFMTKPKQ